MSEAKKLIISYVPLLESHHMLSPGEQYCINNKNQEDIEKLLEPIYREEHDGQAAACLWVIADQKPMPIFVIENAKAIYEHLKKWSENDVENWFHIATYSNDERYGIALMPNIEKSIQRHKTARFILQEEIESGEGFVVISRPLHFVSLQKGTWDTIEPQIKDQLKLGLLDIADIDQSQPHNIDIDKVLTVGPFNLEQNSEYIRDMISQKQE